MGSLMNACNISNVANVSNNINFSNKGYLLKWEYSWLDRDNLKKGRE